MDDDNALSPEAAAEVERRKADALRQVEYLRKRIAQYEAQAADAERRVRRRHATADRLRAAGFKPHLSAWSDTVEVALDPDRPLSDQLKAVWRVTGRLQLWDKQIEDPKRKLVRVTLRSAADDGPVEVTYVKKLTKKDKCKIVTVRPEPRRELVCGV